jgi:hypothetical protein
MSKNNSWIVWVVALIAVVALIVAIVALSNASVTGKGIFSFGKKTLKQTKIPISSQGILADAYLSVGGDKNFLKGYEVKYDENGELIYEIVDEGTRIVVGSSYSSTLNGNILTLVVGGGSASITKVCGCDQNLGQPCSSICTAISNGQQYNCEGTCSGIGCKTTTCKWLEIESDDSLNSGNSSIANLIETKYDDKGNLIYQRFSDGTLKKGANYSMTVRNNIVIFTLPGVGSGGSLVKVCGCANKNNGLYCSSACSSTPNPDGTTKCSGTCTGQGCSNTFCDWIIGTGQE